MSHPEKATLRAAEPCIMVIFGATGDLTKRKLIPALAYLAEEELLPPDFAILGVARQELDDEAFCRQLDQDIQTFATSPVDVSRWAWMRQRLHFLQGDLNDAAMYDRLAGRIAEVDRQHGGHGNVLFYLAVAPRLFGQIVWQLGAAGLTAEGAGHWRRVIIEKPFGHDLASAMQLNAQVKEVLGEQQIYRIDHYLGKETVQNILVFRFGNAIFEPIWNRRYIDHVQITAAETVGLEQRGGYFDAAGALRDMVPNHLLQLVSLTAMEPPVSFEADAVRDEQAKVLHAVQPPSPEAVLTVAVRGQYGAGVCDGQPVPGYREEPDVQPDSPTETYAALKLTIDNWRWADVPFYLRTGKRLAQRDTALVIRFRRVPFLLFRDTPIEHLLTNELAIHIQPEEGISLRFGAKVPGPIMRQGTVKMSFNYADYFGATPRTGYERLLYDSMIGDATLFQRADMVEAGWSIIAPILDVWQALPPRAFPNYPAGSWGPAEAAELMHRDGRDWHDPAED
jgi:glucose-6-phosphate 1-dehydrogenase